MKEISLSSFEGIRIGQAENKEAGTGCTVFIADKGMAAGLDVRGGGPASRESELLKPLAAAEIVHAVVLSGGSAFGLDAAGGVMKYLEERGIGFQVADMIVPLVCQSDIFDLTIGDGHVRPDGKMAYEACLASENGGNYKDGNFGVGCGASVGKTNGMEYCMKTGIGSYAVEVGDLKVAAVVAVNALGDVYDWKNGQKVAGLLAEDKKSFRSAEEELYKRAEMMAEAAEADGKPGADAAVEEPSFAGNTTIGIIITNGKFPKAKLCKIAGMAHDGMARAIRPIHTTADGDSIYAVSVGDVEADQDTVGTLAAYVMSEAILRAAKNADGEYGYPAYKDFFAEA